MKYSVYGLINPITRRIFYVGYSCNPKRRLMDHRCDPAAGGYQTCQKLKATGLKPILCIFRDFEDKFQAKLLERELILSFPDELDNHKTLGMLSLVWHPIEQNYALDIVD